MSHLLCELCLYCCSIASDVNTIFRETAADHLLLFVSALIPKAMASLLTSAVLELSKSDNVTNFVINIKLSFVVVVALIGWEKTPIVYYCYNYSFCLL